MIWDMLVQPFVEFGFMRKALVGCFALALSCGPLGTLLVLRRMSLMGDALSHALLPGAAAGFALAGFSLAVMSGASLVAGLLVALLSGWVSRVTSQKEDASFAGFYLMALAGGVLIVSLHGSPVDLMHILFGSVLAVDNASLYLVASVSTVSLLVLAVIYRPLIVECFDPLYLRQMRGHGAWAHVLFLVLVVMNLVAGFQTMGTLMGVGLMMLPAVAARFWVKDIGSLMAIAVLIGVISVLGGLLMSYHWSTPSGPSIVLLAGGIYVLSIGLGRHDSLLSRQLELRHHKIA
jgi:zinc/manganese transport system permease protein